MNRLILYLLILLAFSSCVIVESTQLEVVKPAKLILPAQVHTIGLLNHNVIKQESAFKTEIQQGLYRLDSVNSEMLVYKVYEELAKSPRFSKVELNQSLLLRNENQLTKPTHWDTVNAYCDSLQVDVLLSLEAMVINDTLKAFSYSDGYSTIRYEVLSLMVHSLWRMYLPISNKELVHKELFSDTIILDQIENYEHLEQLLKRKEGIAWLASMISGEQYLNVSDKIAPYWVAEPRVYLRGINTDFRLAAKYAENDQWIKAAEIWQKHADTKQKYIAAASCFNMALACEVQGKLNLSKSWIDKSLSYKKSDLSIKYQEIINARIAEQNQLNNQFGIIN